MDHNPTDSMNMALTCRQYFREGKYQHALGEASKAVETDPTDVYGHIALSESLLHLRDYRGAVLALRDWQSHVSAESALQRAQNCLEEHQTGRFDVAAIMNEAALKQRVMRGDFINSDVELNWRDKVRGLFAKGDIKRGSLIIAEKAVFSVFPEDPCTEESTLAFDYKPGATDETDEINIRLIFKAIKSIIQYQSSGHIFNLKDTSRIVDSDTKQVVKDEGPVSILVPLQFQLNDDLDEWYNNSDPLTPVIIESIVRSCEYKMEAIGLRLPEIGRA